MSEFREGIRLAVFDVNGTIHSDETGIPDEVLCGLAHLQQQEIKTTSITGRGMNRLKGLLGVNFETVISPGTPISVENGSRLVAPGGQNLRHYTLDEDEITAVIDGVTNALEEIDYVAYYPHDAQTEASGGASLMLGPGNERVNLYNFYKQHGLHRSLGSLSGFNSRADLAVQLKEQRPSMIIIGADPRNVAQAFPDSNIITNGAELNIMSEGVDKAKGVEDLADFMSLSLSEVFVAGNDHNDLTMLGLPVGESVAVAGIIDGETDPDVHVLQSPEALGVYLGSFIGADISGTAFINKEAA